MKATIVGRTCIFFVLYLKITTLFCLNFKVSKSNACPPKDSLFSVLLGIPVDQCVDKCTRRASCDVIGYKGSLQFCELHTRSSTADISDSHCLMIRRVDMTAKKECSCGDWDVCDVKHSNTCSRKECPVLRPLQHGSYLGNLNRIGTRRRVLCDYCYTWQGENNVLECMENGKWSQNITCNLIDCGELPTLGYGNLTLDTTGNTTCGATATVSCDLGYVTSKEKISCLDSGKWQNVVCNILVCPSVGGELNLTEEYKIKLFKQDLNHSEAAKTCKDETGAHSGLLKLDKPWKIEVVFQLLTQCEDYKGKRLWIDGEVRDKNGYWYFENGSKIVMNGPIQWFPRRPYLDRRLPLCLELKEAQWRDRVCSKKQWFICEEFYKIN